MDNKYYNKGGKEYTFRVILLNKNDSETIVHEFNPNLIEELVIEDNFFQWYSNGYLVYANHDEVFERGSAPADGRGNPVDPVFFYKYRFDCYDQLVVSIKPKDTSDDFLIEHKFVVYDVEDIASNNNQLKVKKLYFWDLEYQMMLDKNLAWSSGMHSKFTGMTKEQKFKLTNYERSLRADENLELFLEDPNICNFAGRIDRDLWRQTSKEHLFFYTSPSQNFLADDLEYLISNSVGDEDTDFSPMIFRKEGVLGSKQNDKFSFLPLSEYYEKAQTDFFMENFFLQYKGHQDKQMLTLKSPDYFNTKSYTESVIFNYQYSQSSGIDNSRAYLIKPQLYYSHGSGQFNWDITWNTPSVAKKYVASKMTKHLKQLGDTETNTLVLLNKYKKSKSYTVEPEYNMNPTRNGRLISGRNKLVESMIQLNDSITFTARGLTSRGSGRFIGIDLMAGFPNIDFDNRLLGQWFVVKISHIFFKTGYMNELTCVKTHSYQNLKPLAQDFDPDELNTEGWPEPTP